ncbi:Shikimate kinase 2 [bioreactor metagenome]|uniref:Shikimate kinase 2 n=1 Tax=bioreactor metagenome TaxID=1076179 RepID=A0A644X152_9ZZZZ
MDNIILIGMPGAGKSTVGVLAAKALGYAFLDTDLLLQARQGMLLQNILNTRGIEAFLSAEETAIREICCGRTVIATGGSVVCEPSAMTHLKNLGKIVWLRVPLPELSKRLSNISTRGIALGPGETLKDIYQSRSPLYQKYAEITVDASGQRLEETVAMLLRELA